LLRASDLVVFNNTLYFATFAPSLAGGTACSGGVPRICHIYDDAQVLKPGHPRPERVDRSHARRFSREQLLDVAA